MMDNHNTSLLNPPHNPYKYSMEQVVSAGHQPKGVVEEMEDKEIAENHAPNAPIKLMDGNTLYTTLGPSQEVFAGN